MLRSLQQRISLLLILHTRIDLHLLIICTFFFCYLFFFFISFVFFYFSGKHHVSPRFLSGELLPFLTSLLLLTLRTMFGLGWGWVTLYALSGCPYVFHILSFSFTKKKKKKKRILSQLDIHSPMTGNAIIDLLQAMALRKR